MTPQQKRAWYGLAIGIVWTLALVAVFFVKGATAFDKEAGMRAIVYLLFIAGGIALPPMRCVIWNALDWRDRFKDITILYGARTVADLVYK